MQESTHLDIGCGAKPRNPFNQRKLFCVDIYRSSELSEDVVFKQANLFLQNIPFEDNIFDSVSAYDFLEHVPRILSIDGKQTTLPFIALMNEIWRVLKPNGIFYAITPVYPHPDSFKDPTHVNFITDGTHEYFTGPKYARPYGFIGDFEVKRVQRVFPRIEKHADTKHLKCIKTAFRSWIKFKSKSHIVWELTAIK